MRLKLRMICPLVLALTFALTGLSQSSADQDSSTGPKTVRRTNDNSGPAKQMGRGGEDIGKGVAKGSADLGKGVAGGVGNLATGHGVGAAASVGKGAAGLGKNVGVGTGKGAGKIGKGIGGEFKKLGRKSRKDGRKNE